MSDVRVLIIYEGKTLKGDVMKITMTRIMPGFPAKGMTISAEYWNAVQSVFADEIECRYFNGELVVTVHAVRDKKICSHVDDIMEAFRNNGWDVIDVT